MKFPYGISDFKKINTQGYYYCDRTDKIPLLEKSDFQLRGYRVDSSDHNMLQSDTNSM